MSKKISDFVSESISLSDEVTFVNNGTNFKTQVSDLIKLFGALGTLTSVGEADGTPVLEQPTTCDNKIRKLSGGAGILPSLSPSNGIKLDLNAINGGIGAKVLVNPSASQSVFRTITAGQGVNVVESGDEIQISAIEEVTSSKTVIVSEESDFPTPVGGVITLENDKDYFIIQDVTTSNRFVVGASNTIRSASSQLITLKYTGSGTMFTGVDSNLKINSITISAPLGQLFDMSNTAPTGVFQLVECNIEECDSIGTLNNMFIVRFYNVGWEDIKTTGVELQGTILNVSIDTSVIFLNSGTFLDLGTSVINEMSVSAQVVQPTSSASATFLSGLANSANMLPGGIGIFTENKFAPLATPLIGVTPDNNRYEFIGNSNISDSISDGLMWVEGSTTETVITTAGVKVKVNNIWTDEDIARFTFDSNGRLTYTGERDARLPIDVTTTLLMASGADKQCDLCIAINGSSITPTCKQSTVSSTKAASVTTLWQHDFTNGDYVEVFVSNEDDTTNIIVQQAIVRVN